MRLGRDTTVCGAQLVLAPNPQPAGSTYRWQDGSTNPTYVAKATGRYRVTVRVEDPRGDHVTGVRTVVRRTRCLRPPARP